jgi:hypothetical protein
MNAIHTNHFSLLHTMLHREFLVVQTELLYVRMFKILMFLIGCYRIPQQINYDIGSMLRLLLLIFGESIIVYCFLLVNLMVTLVLSAVVWTAVSQAISYYTRIFNWTFIHFYVRCFYLLQSTLVNVH